MDRDFLEKRKKDLNAYLQVKVLHLALFVPEILNAFIALRHFVECILIICACVFQLLLNPEMVKACPTLIPYVYDFLENKAYSKGKGEFARKVTTFFSSISVYIFIFFYYITYIYI